MPEIVKSYLAGSPGRLFPKVITGCSTVNVSHRGHVRIVSSYTQYKKQQPATNHAIQPLSESTLIYLVVWTDCKVINYQSRQLHSRLELLGSGY